MFDVVSAVELGLGANTKLPIDRLQWTTNGIMFPHPGPVVTIAKNNKTLPNI